jgi:hypothetical protein
MIRRWFLPLGMYSPTAHAAGPDWRSLCGMWDLARPGVTENDVDRPHCDECTERVGAGASTVSGGETSAFARADETAMGSVPSPLTRPAPRPPTDWPEDSPPHA